MASGDLALNVQQKLMSSRPTDLDKMIPVNHIYRIMMDTSSLEGDDVPQRTREFVQICVSRFLSQVVSGAVKKCKREGRKAITADDLVWSLSHSPLACYADAARDCTHRYRALEANEKLSKRQPTGSNSLLVFNQAMPLSTMHDLSQFSIANKPQTSRNASALRSAAQARAIWQKARLQQLGDAPQPAPAPTPDASAGGVTVGNAESDDELFALAEHAEWEHNNIHLEEWHELPLFPSLTAGRCTHCASPSSTKKRKACNRDHSFAA
jgi:histone H3/H4